MSLNNDKSTGKGICKWVKPDGLPCGEKTGYWLQQDGTKHYPKYCEKHLKEYTQMMWENE